MAVVGQSGYIGRWSLPSMRTISETNEAEMAFTSMDYVLEDNVMHENSDLVVAGYRKCQASKDEPLYIQKNIRILNSKSDIKNNSKFFDFYPAELGKYTQVKHVKLNNKCSGLLASNDQGLISILPMPF